MFLFKAIAEFLFLQGNEEIDIRNNFAFSDITFSYSNRSIEVDIWVPKCRLAIEYQGRQHYSKKAKQRIFEDREEIRKRDTEKKKLCEEHGITLIQIPYWWDKSLLSLQDIIFKVRPDLFHTPSVP